MPTFYPEGNTALPTDSPQRSLVKLVDLGASGGSGGGGESGVGSPEGVVTAEPGTTYLDTATNSFYAKGSGSGNTGWVALIV